MLEEVKKNMRKNEQFLSSYATKSKDAIRFKEETEDLRPAFFRDTDRVIHSLSYSRYLDKTQVFSNVHNDHITKRIIHVQMVSKIARTIGRALNLNEDLIEAIALGHDIGHTPFGHPGEKILSDLSLQYTGRYFNHNIHSVRTFMRLESGGKGKNLCLQTLDGIMCHNGEFMLNEYHSIPKDKEKFLEEMEKSYVQKDFVKTLKPMTLEGCVVRISDVIAYLGKDIEDAILLGVIQREEIPKHIREVFGNDNREFINTVILDVISQSYGKTYITFSKEIFKAIVDLKKFNYAHIYEKANSKEQLQKYREMFTFLFETYLEDLQNKNEHSSIYAVFLNTMDQEYLQTESNEQKIIDFLAGMTDDYFMKEYQLRKKGL